MDPQTMWQTLKERLDNTTNKGRPILLHECLHNERYNGEGSISSFISTVLTYREQLADTNQALTDQDMVTHLIMNLPLTWQLIKTIILNQPAIHKTLNYVINTLTNYEIQLQKQEEAKLRTTALVTVTNTNSQNHNAADKSNWTKGHRITQSHRQGYGCG